MALSPEHIEGIERMLDELRATEALVLERLVSEIRINESQFFLSPVLHLVLRDVASAWEGGPSVVWAEEALPCPEAVTGLYFSPSANPDFVEAVNTKLDLLRELIAWAEAKLEEE